MFLVSEVHSFVGGNGRLARMMMNAKLCAWCCLDAAGLTAATLLGAGKLVDADWAAVDVDVDVDVDESQGR